MELTQENKLYIDSLGIEQLLRKIRFAKLGDKWMQGWGRKKRKGIA